MYNNFFLMNVSSSDNYNYYFIYALIWSRILLNIWKYQKSSPQNVSSYNLQDYHFMRKTFHKNCISRVFLLFVFWNDYNTSLQNYHPMIFMTIVWELYHTDCIFVVSPLYVLLDVPQEFSLECILWPSECFLIWLYDEKGF